MMPSPGEAKAVLTHLVQIGVYALVIFLVILLFRRAFRDKARPALRAGLWFLLLLRLTVPVTVTSAVHMIVLPAQETAAPVAAARQSTPLPVRPSVAAVSPQPGEAVRKTPAPSAQEPERPAAVKGLSLSQWLLLTWAVGAVALLVRQGWMWGLLTVRLRDGAREPGPEILQLSRELCQGMGLKRHVRVRVMPDITSPALTVGLKPTVLLPSRLAEEGREQERRFALLHELTHFQRGDHLVMLWSGALRCLWWFHPVLYLMEKPFRMDMEAACDAKAVAGMSREEKLAYTALLLELSREETL